MKCHLRAFYCAQHISYLLWSLYWAEDFKQFISIILRRGNLLLVSNLQRNRCWRLPQCHRKSKLLFKSWFEEGRRNSPPHSSKRYSCLSYEVDWLVFLLVNAVPMHKTQGVGIGFHRFDWFLICLFQNRTSVNMNSECRDLAEIVIHLTTVRCHETWFYHVTSSPFVIAGKPHENAHNC